MLEWPCLLGCDVSGLGAVCCGWFVASSPFGRLEWKIPNLEVGGGWEGGRRGGGRGRNGGLFFSENFYGRFYGCVVAEAPFLLLFSDVDSSLIGSGVVVVCCRDSGNRGGTYRRAHLSDFDNEAVGTGEETLRWTGPLRSSRLNRIGNGQFRLEMIDN